MVGTALCAVRTIKFHRRSRSGRRSAESLPTRLSVLPIEAGDFALGLAIGGALFQIGALIVRHFSRRDADLGFQFSVLPIQAQDDKGTAGDGGESVKFVDF